MKVEELKKLGAFYQLPKAINETDLTVNAKFLYMQLLDLCKVTAENYGLKPKDETFCFYTVEQMAAFLGCSDKTAKRIKKELVTEGLLKSIKQGTMKADILYISLPKSQEDGNAQQEAVLNDLDSLASQPAPQPELIKIESEPEPEPELPGMLSADKKAVMKDFEENFGRLLSSFEYEEIKYMLDENPLPLVREALKRAVLNGTPKVRYIEGILRNWRNNNITTLEQVEAREDQRQKQKDSYSDSYNNNYSSFNSYDDEDDDEEDPNNGLPAWTEEDEAEYQREQAERERKYEEARKKRIEARIKYDEEYEKQVYPEWYAKVHGKSEPIYTDDGIPF